MNQIMQIAIDGPAGSGKSTIAKLLAGKYNFTYIDTGAMYRAVGLYMKKHKIDINDEESVKKGCEALKIDLDYDNDTLMVLLNGEDVSTAIRNEEIGAYASVVSSYKAVRAMLVEMQRLMASSRNVVMDGRDIGTNVLIDADVKIYLTASVKIRGERRAKELMEKGIRVDIQEIEADIRNRDFRDMNRELNPLCKANDAVEIDSSTMSIEAVVEKIGSIIDAKYKNS